MDKARRQTGSWGEDAAVAWLKRKGLKILDRNFRCPAGEIDIVAREGRTIVFVEVKTRRSDRFGYPVEGVDERKQRRLSLLALYYLREKGWEGHPARFDVVGVSMVSEGEMKIEWIKDAFDFRNWG